MRYIDIKGNKYGHLLAIKRVEDYITPNGYKIERWQFKCDCGKVIERNKNYIIRGECCSCGCEKSKRTIRLNKLYKTKHKMKNTKLYHIWGGIKTRCYNKLNHAYGLYGGRGIIMCDEWKNDFLSFYNWAIQNGYRDDLTIDRIDVNGIYCPENCRWVSMKEQSRNKRTNAFVEYNGEIRCIAEWADILKKSPQMLRYRLKNGWSISDAFNKKTRDYKKTNIKGENYGF